MIVTRQKLIIIAAIAVVLSLIAATLHSNFKLARVQKAVHEATHAATDAERRAAELEKQTYVYQEKISSLEQRISGLRRDAAEQDERLERVAADADSARRALAEFRKRTNGK